MAVERLTFSSAQGLAPMLAIADRPSLYPACGADIITQSVEMLVMPLVWSRIAPDVHYDFIATEDGVDVGRVVMNLGGSSAGTWFWACMGCQRSDADPKPLDGEAQTKDEAIQALSEAWARANA